MRRIVKAISIVAIVLSAWGCSRPLSADEASVLRDEIKAQYWCKDHPEGYYNEKLFADVLDKCDRLIARDTSLMSLGEDYMLKIKILSSLGRKTEVRATFEDYAMRLPESNPIRSAIHGYLARLRGDKATSVECYRQAAKQFDADSAMPDYNRLWLKAVMYFRAGDREEAQVALEELKRTYSGGKYINIDHLSLQDIQIYCLQFDNI